jgi:23S rRNA (uracil1939-C5)-methyltransferase
MVERATIERLAAGGDGLARLADGKVVFVAGGLPGDVVDVAIVQSKKDYARGEIAAIVDPSLHRVAEPCVHRLAGCGGCDLMHSATASQLTIKADLVRDALRRTARVNEPDLRLIGSVTEHRYRTTLRLAPGADGRLGMRAARSRAVVPIDDCLVADELLVDVVRRSRGTSGEVQARVSVATGEASLWALDDDLLATPDGVVTGPRSAVVERIAGNSLRVSAASFFQSGPQAATLLVDRVSAIISEVVGEPLGDRHVLDAYGGVGLFSTAVGADRITLVESNPSACADAAVNLADRAGTIRHLPMEQWQPEPVDVVIADPARAGLGAPVVASLSATGASLIVLVSCDPVAMARDVAAFAHHGYGVRWYELLDLFPNTHHVEVISCLVPEKVFR